MGLRIQNNIEAMNTQRQLGISSSHFSKSLERLSSGFRINRAADDAAGLAVSQSFRADIASYKVAVRNTSEANALLQVAEGSLDQMGNILTRLKELATQAASGNAGSNIDKINDEANQLVEEFDRIATSTTYAGTDLLTGSLAAGSMAGTLDASGHSSTAQTTGSDSSIVGVASTLTGFAAPVASLDASVSSLADDDNTWTIANDATASGLVLSNGNGMQFTATANTDADTITVHGMGANQSDLVISTDDDATGAADGKTITFNNLGLSEVSVENDAETGVYTFSTTGSNIVLTHSDGTNQSVAAAASSTLDFDELGISFDLGAEWDANDLDALTITVAGTSGSSMDFQIGAENADDNRLSISLADSQAATLNLTADMLSTQGGAQTALGTIDAAINQLSDNRSAVGAYMNRLSYASANLASMTENVQSAESVIRDVDMASEMTDFTKNQILMQAGTAMLAQANMAPQSVLSLIG